MNARIFSLPNQAQHELNWEIPSLLRRYLYEDIQVLSSSMTDYDLDAARSYLRLLRSSMIRADDFRIAVEESNKHFWYLGYEPSDWYRAALKLPREKMSSLFPAVAVLDRMVMLPQEIQGAFDSSRELAFFPRPLDLQGVLLVDFKDERAVREAVRQVGVEIKDEIAKLCRRYMFVNNLKTERPDFCELAGMLKVDQRFLEHHRQEIFRHSVKLTPRIVSGPARLLRKSKVVLEIQNESEDELREVTVQVRAPSDSLKTAISEYLDFSPGQARIQKIQFEVVPSTCPYCPLEVRFIPNEVNLNLTYTPFPIPAILDVVEK